MTTPEISYRRDVLIEVIIYHQRVTIEGCWCGWGVLGESHAAHVVDVYEASVQART